MAGVLESVARGENRWHPWVEELSGLCVPGTEGFYVEYVHWRYGAELRIRRQLSGELVAVEGSVPFYWLTEDQLCVQEQAVRFLKKVSEGEKAVRAKVSAAHALWRQKHPALAEYLETDAWEEGGERKTATLLLFCDQGVLKGCLNDRETGRSLWVTGESLESLLGALEAMLATGSGEWRVSAWNGTPQRGPKSKR